MQTDATRLHARMGAILLIWEWLRGYRRWMQTEALLDFLPGLGVNSFRTWLQPVKTKSQSQISGPVLHRLNAEGDVRIEIDA